MKKSPNPKEMAKNYRSYRKTPEGMEIHTGNIQYLKDGKWTDIDLTFTRSGTNWELTTAPYSLRVPSTANHKDGILFTNQGHSIKIIPECNPVQIEQIDINRFKYEDAFSAGIHLEVSGGRNNRKIEVIIDKKPIDLSNDLEFRFKIEFENVNGAKGINSRVSISNNPIADLKGKRFTEQIVFSKDEESKSYLRKAYVRGNDEKGICVPLEFEEDNGVLYLIKRISKEFLKGASYPVRTDDDASYFSGGGDGYIRSGGLGTWDGAHNAYSGAGAYYGYDRIVVNTEEKVNAYYIERGFLPFNTTGLAQDIVISAATVTITAYSVTGSGNYGIVQTTQPNHTVLAAADYDTCGSTHGAVEGAPRVSISGTGKKVFTLNATGRGWIKHDGSTWTKLGIREGHDLNDNTPTSLTEAIIRSKEYTGTGDDPVLSVTYDTVAGTIAMMSNYYNRMRSL